MAGGRAGRGGTVAVALGILVAAPAGVAAPAPSAPSAPSAVSAVSTVPAPRAAPSSVAPSSVRPGRSDGLAVDRSATERVAELIGTGTPDDTGRRFGVEGSDLGHMIRDGDRLAIVFGDTFGAPPSDPFFAVPHEDWRSNVLGWIDASSDPADGLRIDRMVTDRPGHASELLSSLKRRGVEQTVIPTQGLAVGSSLFLHYMSVLSFDEPGHWRLRGAGIARSDDGGRTWRKDPDARWPGDTAFGQVAYVDPADRARAARDGADVDDVATGALAADADPDAVYVYGIPGGRYGGVSLARVSGGRLDDPAAYRYWAGSAWSSDPGAAHEVLPAPVGELSVRYHDYYGRWLMTYLVDPTGDIVMRTAPAPTGPWSDPQVITTTERYPQAYAPYLTPAWTDGPEVYFTLSQYDSYRVSLFRTRLRPLPAGVPVPRGLLPRVPGPTLLGPRPNYPFDNVPG